MLKRPPTARIKPKSNRKTRIQLAVVTDAMLANGNVVVCPPSGIRPARVFGRRHDIRRSLSNTVVLKKKWASENMNWSCAMTCSPGARAMGSDC
jgi:hypothetical protein